MSNPIWYDLNIYTSLSLELLNLKINTNIGKFLDPVVDKRHERAEFMVNLRKKTKQIIFKNKRIEMLEKRQKDTPATCQLE